MLYRSFEISNHRYTSSEPFKNYCRTNTDNSSYMANTEIWVNNTCNRYVKCPMRQGLLIDSFWSPEMTVFGIRYIDSVARWQPLFFSEQGHSHLFFKVVHFRLMVLRRKICWFSSRLFRFWGVILKFTSDDLISKLYSTFI